MVLAGAATQLVPQAAGQTGDGWTTLLDDKNMGDWNKVGESNWRMEDGALVADKKTSQDPAYLVSKSAYKDFQLHIEFWASDDANSGIFLRCQDPAKIADRSCYEANIFDQRRTRPTVPAASFTSPKSIRCRRPAANGTRMRSPRRAGRLRSC